MLGKGMASLRLFGLLMVVSVLFGTYFFYHRPEPLFEEQIPVIFNSIYKKVHRCSINEHFPALSLPKIVGGQAFGCFLTNKNVILAIAKKEFEAPSLEALEKYVF